MSFFSQLASAVANNLLNPSLRGSETDPLKVVEVSSSAFSSRSVCQREQCLLVYGNGNNVQGFELVMVVLVTGHRDKLYRYIFKQLQLIFNQIILKIPCLHSQPLQII